MQTKIQVFTDHVTRQNNILQQLIQLAEEKKRYIILGQVEELDKCIQKEGIIISNLDQLEGARFTLQAEIADKLGMPVAELTASNMIRIAREQFPASAPALETALKSLEQNIQRLREQIQENNELLKMSLDYIDEMYYLLSPDDDAGVYSEKGTTDTPGKNIRIIDKKA